MFPPEAKPGVGRSWQPATAGCSPAAGRRRHLLLTRLDQTRQNERSKMNLYQSWHWYRNSLMPTHNTYHKTIDAFQENWMNSCLIHMVLFSTMFLPPTGWRHTIVTVCSTVRFSSSRCSCTFTKDWMWNLFPLRGRGAKWTCRTMFISSLNFIKYIFFLQ